MPKALPDIAVVNRSTLVTVAQARAIVEACAVQLRDDIAPAWDRRPRKIALYTAEAKAPKACPLGVILDDSDQAGALGYHAETPDGRPYFRVFAKPILAAGGGVLAGSYSVSATTSHEIAELEGDSAADQWVDNGNNVEFALELGDPVEAGSYPVKTSGGVVVMVSNFVYPAWFDPQAMPGGRFDHLDTVAGPFRMSPGGYVIIRKGGQVTQQFGAVYPQWRKETKAHPAARSARRRAQGRLGRGEDVPRDV